MSQGKGDTYRPVDNKKFAENYDRIFGKKPEVIDPHKFSFSRVSAIITPPVDNTDAT